MKDLISAVLDTNIIVSGFISSKGNPAKIIDKFLEKTFLLITSPKLLTEFNRVINSKKIRTKYNLDKQDIDDFTDAVNKIAETVPCQIQVSISRDKKDDMFLSCALEGKADYLVTGDSDLLVIKEFGKTKIITPKEFLDVLLNQ